MANNRQSNKAKLSKGILEMKFMQRTKKKLAEEQEEAEGRAMYSEHLTDRMLNNQQSNFMVEPSYVLCEGLVREGRYSFRGMNPEIERVVEQETEFKRRQQEEQQQRNRQKCDVSNEEMAQFFYDGTRTTSLSKNMANKFRKRNAQQQHKLSVEGNGGGRQDDDIQSPGRAKGKKMLMQPEKPKQLSENFKNQFKNRKFLKPRDELEEYGGGGGRGRGGVGGNHHHSNSIQKSPLMSR